MIVYVFRFAVLGGLSGLNRKLNRSRSPLRSLFTLLFFRIWFIEHPLKSAQRIYSTHHMLLSRFLAVLLLALTCNSVASPADSTCRTDKTKGFLNRRFKWRFCLLFSTRRKVGRRRQNNLRIDTRQSKNLILPSKSKNKQQYKIDIIQSVIEKRTKP